jgi:hypothetical protein
MEVSENFSIHIISSIIVEQTKLMKVMVHYESFLKEHYPEDYKTLMITTSDKAIRDFSLLRLNTMPAINDELKRLLKIYIENMI